MSCYHLIYYFIYDYKQKTPQEGIKYFYFFSNNIKSLSLLIWGFYYFVSLLGTLRNWYNYY